MNQSVAPSYRLPTPVVGGTAVSTAHPRWPIAVQAAQASTSPSLGDTDHGMATTNPRAAGSDPRWNQP
jgi:hypothetical protein